MSTTDEMLKAQEAQFSIPKGYALTLDGKLEKVPPYQPNPNTKRGPTLLELFKQEAAPKSTPPIRMKRRLEEFGKGDRSLYKIGDDNLAIGLRVKVTWLKPWGGQAKGYIAEGILLKTMAVNSGRTLIGEIKLDSGKKQSCPWSKNYLAIELT